MRLSDEGLRQRQTKALYPNHRNSPGPTKTRPRDRSNRLLDINSRRIGQTAAILQLSNDRIPMAANTNNARKKTGPTTDATRNFSDGLCQASTSCSVAERN